ncbi:cold-shock protein, DNA-binding [Candidatus Vecturithrix granuli]|uniref:Cold-shock protein, DNA-binding n=1 Tax=Vecturithrix granuli TaxID=1499967 RepID=A0A081BXK6_VECG1|nr:cold-shock protein, DNA-binding [Candidatus Vecturithrix granuli]
MAELIRLLQREVFIGDKVIFFLKTGKEISGVLSELSQDHVILRENGRRSTILLDMIGGWDVLQAESPRVENLEVETPQIESIETQNLEAENLEAEIPQVEYPETQNPELQNLEAENLEVEISQVEYPETQNQEVESLEMQTSQVERPEAQGPEANNIETNIGQIESSKSKILEKLLKEIESRFQANLQVATVHIKPPDFTFPVNDFDDWKKTDSANVWNRVKNMYENAKKINDLNSQFGRIQRIISDLKILQNRYPGSPSVMRCLGYFNWLVDDKKVALTNFKEVAFVSEDAYDWYNVAAIALEEQQQELCCFSLEQIFKHLSITEEQDAWYLYVKLLKKFDNYLGLLNLIEKAERSFSEEEINILLETGIYLLKVNNNQETAIKLIHDWSESQEPKYLILEAFKQLDRQPNSNYQQVIFDLNKEIRESSSKKVLLQPQGYIYTYQRYRNFGFLQGEDGEQYFFHRSAIVDDELFELVKPLYPGSGKRIPVIFEAAQGPRGPLAIQVSLYRPLEEMFELAKKYANEGEYSKALMQLKKVIAIHPEYPEAQISYEKWREYAQSTSVPRGSTPYARAKRVQLIEKDLERAVQLFQVAIDQKDSIESAVKDLAGLLAQLGRHQEAINIIETNRNKISNKQSLDNLLINIYQSAGKYDKVLSILQKKIDRATTKTQKTAFLWQIATIYLRQEAYNHAEQNFREVLKLQPDNKAGLRNLAICLFKQQHFNEAEEILNNILNTSSDDKAAQILDAITQAKITGQSVQIDNIITEAILSNFSSEISKFTQFFLERCQYEGVPSNRLTQVQNGKQDFNRLDIKQLEDLATQLGTGRAKDRAAYYLSAAKITFDIEEDFNQFYKYLGRSFSSTGDSAISSGKHLDTVRELYCEALSVYDGYRSQHDEQDAVNALVRFLFSTLGVNQIPLTPLIPSIDETVEKVLTLHPKHEKVFDAIAYLIFRSLYAAQKVLNRLYSKSTFQAMALDYLSYKGISTEIKVKNLDEFVHLWNGLRRKIFNVSRLIFNELRFLQRVELRVTSLENSIERVRVIQNHLFENRLFFDLEKQRIEQLHQILETALEFCRQVTFEEQERLCIQINNRCQELLKEIEINTTKLSLEELYPVIQNFQKKITAKLEDLYESSIPQLSLRLAVESYTPGNDRLIEVQTVVENRIGCSPAESLELIVQEDENLFQLSNTEIKLDRSLRGGDHAILKVPVQVTEQAVSSQTFSLPVYAQYRTRSGEVTQTSVRNFSIRLYAEEEFEEIENPYAGYAQGGEVQDPKMFYGRDELIENVSNVILKSFTQSKSIVIFGQKRAGKSSILYHLKRKLQTCKDIVIIDVGNIGSILDQDSSTPFVYLILWGILNKLKYAIEDKTDEGFSPLNLIFPKEKEFCKHPGPLLLFKEIFDQYKRKISKLHEWRNVRLVLLIDEFAYIHEYIVNGYIPETFMKNWKALLQENYFSVVLVGQDVMAKFKDRFPNEFGTTQDERVSYLRREDAIKLIDEPIRIGGRQGESRYREQAITRILDLTAGSPYYIQIICNRLVEYMNRKKAKFITDADVEQVKNELIQGIKALSLDIFDCLYSSGDTSKDAISKEDILKILATIAVNSKTGSCPRSSIVCETTTPVDNILDDLRKRDVIEIERNHYSRIQVGLFKEWLIAHQGEIL